MCSMLPSHLPGPTGNSVSTKAKRKQTSKVHTGHENARTEDPQVNATQPLKREDVSQLEPALRLLTKRDPAGLMMLFLIRTKTSQRAKVKEGK